MISTHLRSARRALLSQEDFEAAAAEVKNFKKVSQADQLILYGYFKQVTVGDCTGSRPGLFDPKGRAKYDAWLERKGVYARILLPGQVSFQTLASHLSSTRSVPPCAILQPVWI